MKIKKRGQISVEYMIVLGFATFAITAIIGLAFYYVNTTNDTMTYNHIKNFADSVISNSESVYFSGYPSKISISPYLPKGVESVEIKKGDVAGTRYELVITYQTSTGQNIVGFKSKVPLVEKEGVNGLSHTEGIKNLVIQFNGPNPTDPHDKIEVTEG